MSPDLPYAASLLVITDTPAASARAAAAVSAAGLPITAGFDLADAETRLADRLPPGIALLELEGAALSDIAVIESILVRLAAGRDATIVSTPASLIDLVAARAPRADQLADATVPEITQALIAASRPPPVAFHETGALPWLAAPAPPAPGGPAEAALLADEIRQALRTRRLRSRYFDPALFADPAWDMLLDLMAARLAGRRIAVSSLCIAAAVPPTTALRWIKMLTDCGLFVRNADPTDGRRVFIDLSDAAADSLRAYLAEIRV